MRRSRTRYRPLVLTLVTVLAITLASGCAGSQPRRAQGPEATANDINPVPREMVRDGGTLRWPLASFPANFNYLHLDGAPRYTRDVAFATLPLAFEADAGAEPRLNRELLEFAEVTATQPKQVVTYRINTEAVWSDGTPITWRDFEAQWKALRGTDPAYQISLSNGYNQVSSVVRGADDREAIVTFSSPYADWKGMYWPLYPASTNAAPQVFNTGWVDRLPLSAGPFRFESLDRAAQTITLVRNERWWGPPAKLDRIIFRVIPLDAQADALANGEIDWMDIGPSVSSYQRLQNVTGVVIRSTSGPNFRVITFNGSSDLLRDVAVRRAVSMAIDRDAIAAALIGPLGVPAEGLGNHLLMGNQPGYEDNGGEILPYDPERAEALLDEAGWRRDGDVRVNGDKELALRLVIPTGVAQSRQEAELAQGMLAQIGARVNIETVPANIFFPDYVNVGNFDLSIFSWLGDPYTVGSNRSIYASPKVSPGGELIVEQNYARIGDEEIDRLFAQANAELDRTRRTELLNQIDARIWEVGHSITMYQRPDIFAGNAALANMGAQGFADRIYEDIGYT